MNNDEIQKVAEWFRSRAKDCPMPATRRMYEIAVEALEELKVYRAREQKEIRNRCPMV